MKKVAFTTLGCRFNQQETLEMEESLRAEYEIVSYSDDAEIYVINSCTVTGKSDHKCRQVIRNTFKRAPNSKIIVTGCYAETQKKEITKIQGVCLVAGNSEKANMKSLVDGLSESGESPSLPVAASEDTSRNSLKKPPSQTSSRRTSAYLKVQAGCDMSCSYCIVTVARGRGQSLPVQQIKREFERLVTSGLNEIVLTGINLGCYGQDFRPKVSIVTLLSELLQVKGVKRIRLSSINPAEVSSELISLIKNNSAVCRHLHVPLQSGDDSVLKSMRRNYTSETFRQLVNRLSNEVDGIGIGTDVIVGYPGETDKSFQNTYDLLQALPLSYLHVFRYSRREGTDAARFSGQVSNAAKQDRSKKLIELGGKKKLTFREGYLNKVVDVLFETRESGAKNYLVGNSDNYIPIIVEGPAELKNTIRPVRLLNIESDRVRGALIQAV